MKPYLSKSQFIRGFRCRKSLWLFRNEPELGAEPDENSRIRMEEGKEVGRLARKLFPGGVEIQFEEGTFAEKVKKTQSLLDDGDVPAIYEANMIFDDVLTVADILVRRPAGWELYEVKSSTQVKDFHLFDLALQYFIFVGCGVQLSKAAIIHLNNEYIRNEDLDSKGLFIIKDLTTEIIGMQAKIRTELKEIRNALDGECPHVDIGEHCDNPPFVCDFMDHCWAHIPEASIFELKGRGVDKFSLYRQGIIRLSDLDLTILNERQRMQVEAELHDRKWLDREGIREFLAKLKYPIYFVDFETFMPAIPPFPGLRPYQKIPYQYSVHVLESKGGSTRHHEFLAEPGTDGRLHIAQTLSELIPEDSSILAYNSQFEKSVIEELAKTFPIYAAKLRKINNNIADLMVPFRRRLFYTKSMKGGYSLKEVLPTLVPELSYEGLEISNGSEAETCYRTLHLVEDPKERERLKKGLFRYCGQDTYGMVKMFEKLNEF